MKLFPSLVLADVATINAKTSFNATTNAHGLYSTQQFVLRLSPEVHRKISSLPAGIQLNSDMGLDVAQAMSTYLHETIHWWQHIGSTYGFILSLNYPIQTHSNYSHLKNLISEDGFKKSVLYQSMELNNHGPTGIGTVAARANIIVNNHFDLLAYRAFTLGPQAAQSAAQHDLFECVGHAFFVTYGQTLHQLAGTIDKDFKCIPNPANWEEGFRKLRENKVNGYYYGSPVDLWPIGSCEIFEGQAQFSQIQYLSHACGHNLDWDSYRTLGMLHGVYVRAFEEFLRLTESEWPIKVNDPIIGLFLLVCDLAINPASGFPAPVHPNYESFITDVNPGARFCTFCRLIARLHPELKTAVQKHNRAEYEAVTETLCAAAKEVPPLLIAKVFSKWFTEGPLASLRNEYEKYQFNAENYVIRHLFAHFLAFQEDKLKWPEFFCWPGAWLAGDHVSQRQVELFDKHSALFVDKEHDDGVFARTQSGRIESVVEATFNTFYKQQMLYELTNQWISKPGIFSYDFSWLAPSKADELKSFLQKQFIDLYGVDPEKVEILTSP